MSSVVKASIPRSVSSCVSRPSQAWKAGAGRWVKSEPTQTRSNRSGQRSASGRDEEAKASMPKRRRWNSTAGARMSEAASRSRPSSATSHRDRRP